MTKALNLDLQKLNARAFDRAEWAEGALLRPQILTVRLLNNFERFTTGCSSLQRYGRLMSKTCWRIAWGLWKKENT